MRVLVIEDDAETARYIAKGLRESGYAVDVVTDGKDGLLQAVGEDYDVAVVDRMLPGLDGLSVVETRWMSWHARSGAAGDRSRFSRASSRCSNTCCATPARW
jgi:DNA-binding response OmpR family regulator